MPQLFGFFEAKRSATSSGFGPAGLGLGEGLAGGGLVVGDSEGSGEVGVAGREWRDDGVVAGGDQSREGAHPAALRPARTVAAPKARRPTAR
ncbi:MAG: hypothetical protein QM713_04330 [Arachnia sp.]